MNIEQEIKELRNKLDELEKQVKNNTKTYRWVIKYLDNYFYIANEGTIIEHQNMSTYDDNYRISTGNCFRTKEEAEKHKRILINTQKLKDLANRLNNGKEIDWNNDCLKYCIYLTEKVLDQNWNISYQSQGTVYCLDRDFLKKAIKEIGKEELIELIKGE